VHYDVVADRIDIFHPLTFGALQLRESPKILERQGRVAGQRTQQPLLRGTQRRFLADQANRAQTLCVTCSDGNENGLSLLAGTSPDFSPSGISTISFPSPSRCGLRKCVGRHLAGPYRSRSGRNRSRAREKP